MNWLAAFAGVAVAGVDVEADEADVDAARLLLAGAFGAVWLVGGLVGAVGTAVALGAGAVVPLDPPFVLPGVDPWSEPPFGALGFRFTPGWLGSIPGWLGLTDPEPPGANPRRG